MLERNFTGRLGLMRLCPEAWRMIRLPDISGKSNISDRGGICRRCPPDGLVALMASRFTRAGLAPPPEDEMLMAAFNVDKRYHEKKEAGGALCKGMPLADVEVMPVPRPLFAAAVAELAVRRVREDEVSIEASLEGLTQDEVLAGLIRRERHSKWADAPEVIDTPEFARHENLLALATLLRGLEVDMWRTICLNQVQDPEMAISLPSPAKTSDHALNAGLMQRMGSPYPDEKINAMEPDILGEYFLLQHLAGLQPDEQACLINAAFCLAPDLAIYTSYLAAKDLPGLAFQSLLLTRDITAPGQAVTQMQLFGALSTDYGAAQQWDRFDACLARAAALQGQFPQDAAIGLEEIKALTNGVSHAGEL